MAKYTTQLRSIVENGTPIFDFTYPVFDEAYKPVLEQKIINHYYFREIGFETVGQFKWFLKTKLTEIMPYYNERYLALEVFKTYNPYVNKDLTTTETRTNTQDIEGTTDTKGLTTDTGMNKTENVNENDTLQTNNLSKVNTGDEKEIFSDTPQSLLSGADYATNLTDRQMDATETDTGTIENKTMGSGTDTQTVDMSHDLESTVTTDNTITTTDEYIQTIKGFDGMKYASEVYLDVIETIENLDVLILDELNELFMNIY